MFLRNAVIVYQALDMLETGVGASTSNADIPLKRVLAVPFPLVNVGRDLSPSAMSSSSLSTTGDSKSFVTLVRLRVLLAGPSFFKAFASSSSSSALSAYRRVLDFRVVAALLTGPSFFKALATWSSSSALSVYGQVLDFRVVGAFAAESEQ